MSAPRCTTEDLAAVLSGVADDPNLNAFVDDAHTIVDLHLGADGAGLPSERLALIEKYMAAHLYTLAVDRGGITKDKVGESETTYAALGKNSGGLQATRFGQLVYSLDTSGLLASFGSAKKSAQFRVV